MYCDIVLAGPCRTPIGKFGGTLAGVATAELGAIVIRESLARAGISGNVVDEVHMGCVLQASQGQNVARQAAIRAGIPVGVTAHTLNIVCGSGLHCVNTAAAAILSGAADIIVAGGMENMSASPYALDKARSGYRMGDGALVDLMIRDALWDAFDDYHMGVTAENIAEKFGITRQMQDEFAAVSQQKCEQAYAKGKFVDEIVPVPVRVKKETVYFAADEYPRTGVTAKSIAEIKPAFKKNGTVTAANASGINDGAAAIVVMRADTAKKIGVTPFARWSGGATAGVEPSLMGIGPVESTKKLLGRFDLSLADIDLIEANEAFAAQSLAVGNCLGWDWDQVNVNGGAIALGHPIGASGCRILVTLLHEMRRRNARRGLATLCVGGGMGVSTVVEAV